MNLIMVLADDLGWNDVSYHGGDIPTPNIDALAMRSVRNEQFYAEPICTPSRAALMTGKYPWRYGLQQIVWPWNHHGLKVGMDTIGDVLRRSGFSTYCVGKWNLGHRNHFVPTNRGFDQHYGCYTGGIDHYQHLSYGVHDFAFNTRPIRPVGHAADLYTNKACEVIAGSADRPFFMYLPYNSPHLPYQSPPEYEARVAHVQDPQRRAYAAMVVHLDDCIGRLVTCLREQRREKDTIIWFSSDNGGWVEASGDNRPFDGGKVGYKEGGVRVVNFAYVPGVQPTVNQSPGHLVDVLPTALSLMKLPPVGGLDGIDQSPYLKGASPATDREIVLGLFARYSVMRHGDWKYIHLPEFDALYNLADDPYEKTPVVNPEVLARFEARHRELATAYVADPPNGWSQPNGWPAGYVFPAFWGDRAMDPIHISIASHEEPATTKEVLGYPKDFKI